MLVPFEQLSEESRIWIYQANREIDKSEIKRIEETATSFFEGWAAHGAPLKCAYKIFHDRFIVIAVDESFNNVSGCSIDSSVSMVKSLENDLHIDFFDRTQIAFVLNDEIYIESLSNLKSKVETGVIEEGTITFNNMVSNKKDLESAWMVPARSTWMSKYFNQHP